MTRIIIILLCYVCVMLSISILFLSLRPTVMLCLPLCYALRFVIPTLCYACSMVCPLCLVLCYTLRLYALGYVMPYVMRTTKMEIVLTWLTYFATVSSALFGSGPSTVSGKWHEGEAVMMYFLVWSRFAKKNRWRMNAGYPVEEPPAIRRFTPSQVALENKNSSQLRCSLVSLLRGNLGVTVKGLSKFSNSMFQYPYMRYLVCIAELDGLSVVQSLRCLHCCSIAQSTCYCV